MFVRLAVVFDRWSNSDSVIVLIVITASVDVDNYVCVKRVEMSWYKS
jgi:hypothetical protein